MITVNGKSFPLNDIFILEEFILKNSFEAGKGIAIAVNEKVIPRNEWAIFKLQNNDRVLMIKATQGG